MHKERDRNDEYYAKKSKKPEQFYQEYQPKQQQIPGNKSEKARYERSFDKFDNRQSRLGSEPRATGSNNFANQDSMKNSFVNSERNRDTRSSEPGAGNHYEHRNKPPSGQPRISNQALQRLPPNIDSLPPRLKKKYLLEAGLPEDFTFDKPMDIPQQSYSNTLPSGRGRNNRYDQGYHHQNYQNSFQPKFNQNHGYQHEHEPSYHRSLTPPLSKSTRPQVHQQQKPPAARYDWKTNDIQKRDATSPCFGKTTKEDSNFDWSEDVLNSQSLPHEVNSQSNANNKYDDNNRHRHRRRRNRR